MIDIKKLNRVFSIYGCDLITSAENKPLKEVVENAIAQYLEKLANDTTQWGIIMNVWDAMHEDRIVPLLDLSTKSPEDIATYRKKKMIEERAKPIYEDYSITEEDAEKIFTQINQETDAIARRSEIIKARELYFILDNAKKVADLDVLLKQADKEVAEIEKENKEKLRKESEIENEKHRNEINIKLSKKNQITFIGKIGELSDQYEASYGIRECNDDTLGEFLCDTVGMWDGSYKITIKIEPIQK